MTGILLGLIGAILIGASDCIARVTTQRVSNSVLILAIMAISTALLTLWLAVTGDYPPFQTWAWLASALSGVLNVVALYLLYLALGRGPVAVASPAASTFAVILVIMNALAGEPWTMLQVISILLVFAGVSMLSRQAPGAATENNSYSTAWLQKTALFGLGAALAIALRMFLAQEATAELGALHGLYLNRLFAMVSCLVLLVIQLTLSQQLRFPKDASTLKLLLAQALLEMAALGVFLAGSFYGGRVSAGIGFSAFAAAAVIIARIFLGELIGWWRALWISVIGLGVMMAIAGSPV
jgi:drug/metabolite transporter (DMT)-like permease